MQEKVIKRASVTDVQFLSLITQTKEHRSVKKAKRGSMKRKEKY